MKKSAKAKASDEEVYYITPLCILQMELGGAVARKVYDALELYARRSYPGAKVVGLVFTGAGGEFIQLHQKEGGKP
jgi:hypothetical protein